MNSRRRKLMLLPFSDERGMAIVVALLALVLMSLLGTLFLTASLTESTISTNVVNDSKAFWIAEAGVQHAVKAYPAVNPTGLLDGTDDIFGGPGKGKGKGKGKGLGTSTVNLADGSYTIEVTNNIAANGFPRGTIPVDPLDAAFAVTEDIDRILVLTSTATVGNIQKSIEVVVQQNGFPMVPGAITMVSRSDGGNNEFDFEDGSLINGADESNTCADQPGFVNSSQYLKFDSEGGELIGLEGDEYGEDVPWRHYDPTKDDPIYGDAVGLAGVIQEWMNLPGVVTLTGLPSGDENTMGTEDSPQITVWNIGTGNMDADDCSGHDDPAYCLNVPESHDPITGHGILIVTGELFIANDFTWHGLIVQKSKRQLTVGESGGTGTQVVHGGILAVDDQDPIAGGGEPGNQDEDTKVDIEDEAQILFNCEALNRFARPLVWGAGGSGTGPVSVLSWRPL